MMPSDGHAGLDLVARAGSLIQHRIQNPLQVIVAEAELLRDTLPTSEAGAAESIEAIRTAARRIADSVTHFDDWARDALAGVASAEGEPSTIPADPALTDALATELRVLGRLVRTLGMGGSAERLQPRLHRVARLADLWLRSSSAAGSTSPRPPAPSRDPEPGRALRTPEGHGVRDRGAVDPSTAAASSAPPARAPASAEVPDDADPRLIALLDRLRRLEQERSILSDRLRSAREEWHFGVHELRNAAQALTGWLDIVGDTPYAEAPWYRPLMQAAQAVLQRAEDALGRVTTEVSPPLEVRPRSLEIGRLAHEALDRVRPLTHEKHLRTALVASPTDRSASVRADPERAMQILLNLLRNSVAATPPDGAILVCVRAEADFGVIEVEDTGPGIPSDLADRLAAKRGAATQEGRSGVGLVLSRRLAERMGGSLEIVSASRAGGARVILRLPRET